MTANGEPVYFIVACMGHSGSTWLAKSLNKHPDIVCSHAFQPPPFSIVDHPSLLELKATLTPEEYQSRHDSAARRVRTLPLDMLFDELMCFEEARAYGNVHMFNLRSLQNSVKKFPPSKSIRVANLIRHPVPWLDSRAGCFNDFLVRASSTRKFFHQKYIDREELLSPLVSMYGLDLEDSETLAFLAAASDLAGLYLEVEVWPDIWFIKMENLTRDRETFAHLVGEITAQTVTADAQYLDAVFTGGKENVHSRNTGKDPEERYANWSEWQKHAYEAMTKPFNLAEIYGKFGYDFGFLA